MLHVSHSGSHAGAPLPAGDICKYLEAVLAVTAPRWHLVGRGRTASSENPRRCSPWRGRECVRISCLLLENNRPSPDATAFQPAIKALGLFRDGWQLGFALAWFTSPRKCGGTAWRSQSEAGSAKVCLSSQKVDPAQRNPLLRGSCACASGGREAVPPALLLLCPGHPTASPRGGCPRAAGVGHPLVIVCTEEAFEQVPAPGLGGKEMRPPNSAAHPADRSEFIAPSCHNMGTQ